MLTIYTWDPRCMDCCAREVAQRCGTLRGCCAGLVWGGERCCVLYRRTVLEWDAYRLRRAEIAIARDAADLDGI